MIIFDEKTKNVDLSGVTMSTGKYRLTLNNPLNFKIDKTNVNLTILGKGLIVEKAYNDNDKIVVIINLQFNPVPILAVIIGVIAALGLAGLTIYRIEKLTIISYPLIIGILALLFIGKIKK